MDNIELCPHIYDNYKYADFFINKKTEYQYSGNNLVFSLSHALFSSYEIDSGSRLLLKTLSPFIKAKRPGSILDAGCGTGILGAALKKTVPEADLFLYDRDALAVYFTELNLSENGIAEYRTAHSLLMFPFSGRKFDLIISNLPAKAGADVLSDFIQQAPLHLTENGSAAVVIVKPLSDFAAGVIKNNNLEILETVKTANYSVFIFRYPEQLYKRASLNTAETDDKDSGGLPSFKSDEELFESYIRREKQLFEIKGRRFNIDTATGLPDFDNLSFNTKSIAELILAAKSSFGSDRKQLVINPGQGFIPVLLKTLCGSSNGIDTFIASNDMLQLKMSERNLIKSGLTSSGTDTFLSTPTVFNTADSFENGTIDTVVYFYSPVPGFKKHDLIMKRLNNILKQGGKLFLVSTASEISRFLSVSRGFVNVKGKKNKGIRAVYLKKSAEA